ncbi:serendipity locus protein H-1-like isoform X2 [Thrips palmi]|nr:serendipity locus protein H-1-like isoform X2 [Thrips palmi]
MDGTSDTGYSIDFEKQELLNGEEVVMEGLESLSDCTEGMEVIQCEDVESGLSDVDPRHRKVDKDDPRSRLHYIKYLKKEGKPMKMWECGICGKEFRHQYTLMRHLPTHTDERNYKCDDCGKAFRQMSTLSQHRAIHSDARPYVCECCKKTFNRVSTLISHRKTHSDMKPHKCPVCFKGFHQKGNLRNHVFTHTNERPYKCEICEKGFNQMSNLVCHKAHVHGDRSRHVCNLCGSEFLRRYALRLHQEYNHGIVYQNSDRPVSKKSQEVSHGRKSDGNVSSQKNQRGLNIMKSSSQAVRGKQAAKTLSPETKAATSSEVLIDPIETKAMKNAKDSGQNTFALFKPAKGIPVLVKVLPAPNNKQMLVPATVEDLKSAGKITVSPNYDPASNGSPIKAVQIKVPVVATVIQRVGENGQLTISVESPGPEQSETPPDEDGILGPVSDDGMTEGDAEMEADEQAAVNTKLDLEADDDGDEDDDDAADVDADAQVDIGPDLNREPGMETDKIKTEPDMIESNMMHYVDEDGTLIALDGSEASQIHYVQDDGTLIAAQPTVIVQPGAASESGNELHQSEFVVGEHESGILQMETADGEVQLVRATGDGTYELISEEEAALFLQNQAHTIEILEDNSDVQLQQMLEEGDDGEILVNQNQLSAFVNAIRSAGYEVMPGEAEDLETDSNELTAVKSEPVHLDLEDEADYM